jgi:membrane protein DedA with SNARE-associated domain
MPWHVFVFWNALGGIAWATSVGLLAYYLGPTVERVFQYIGLGGVAVLALLLAGYFAWRRFGGGAKAGPDG